MQRLRDGPEEPDDDRAECLKERLSAPRSAWGNPMGRLEVKGLLGKLRKLP